MALHFLLIIVRYSQNKITGTSDMPWNCYKTVTVGMLSCNEYSKSVPHCCILQSSGHKGSTLKIVTKLMHSSFHRDHMTSMELLLVKMESLNSCQVGSINFDIEIFLHVHNKCLFHLMLFLLFQKKFKYYSQQCNKCIFVCHIMELWY